jgi:hypothetical protein
MIGSNTPSRTSSTCSPRLLQNGISESLDQSKRHLGTTSTSHVPGYQNRLPTQKKVGNTKPSANHSHQQRNATQGSNFVGNDSATFRSSPVPRGSNTKTCLGQLVPPSISALPVDHLKSKRIVVIALGQCGITVAHALFSLFTDKDQLHPLFFASVPRKEQSTSPSASSGSTNASKSNPLKPPSTLVSFPQVATPYAIDPNRISQAIATFDKLKLTTAPIYSEPKRVGDESNTSGYIPRCVLLDTEPKVVQSISTQFPRNKEGKSIWRYHPKCIHWKSAGAANNWAYGYTSMFFFESLRSCSVQQVFPFCWLYVSFRRVS